MYFFRNGCRTPKSNVAISTFSRHPTLAGSMEPGRAPVDAASARALSANWRSPAANFSQSVKRKLICFTIAFRNAGEFHSRVEMSETF